jgi:hypothetical protein
MSSAVAGEHGSWRGAGRPWALDEGTAGMGTSVLGAHTSTPKG